MKDMSKVKFHEETEDFNNYSYEVELANGEKLSTMFFPSGNGQRIRLEHTAVLDRELGLHVLTRIQAEYTFGLLDDLSITTRIVNSSNSGKKYYVGIDVSEDYKVHLDCDCRATPDGVQLREFTKGSTVLFHEDDDTTHAGIFKQIDSPVPLFTDMNYEYGQLKYHT